MSRSKRNGNWFSLSRSERSLYGLALSLKISFRSFELIRALVSILKKLKQFGDRAYNTLMNGMQLAWVFSEMAVKWGNEMAREWRNDRYYIEYLSKFLVGSAR